MTRLYSYPSLLAAAILSVSLPLSTPAAAQRYLFDHLFGGGRQPAPGPEQPSYPAPPAPPPAAAPKVTGPQYYTYKVDPLVRVDFSRLSKPASAGADPQITNSVTTLANQPDAETMPASGAGAFDESLDALAGYELLAEKQIAGALLAYYAKAHDFIWLADGHPNAGAEAVMAVLGDAAAEGLDPADYAVAMPQSGSKEEAARFEMALSARILRYVRDAQQGRVNPNRISGYHDFAEKPLAWVDVLENIKAAPDAAAYLEGWHPRNPAYGALKAELASLRASAENEIVIDPKTVVKPGETNPEFGKILQAIQRDMVEAYRIEFGALIEQYAGTDVYVPELVPAIKAMQKLRGLTADGVIGPRTVAALVGDSKAAKIDKVRVAMEQLRWLPSQFAPRHVFINVPAFRANYVEDGEDKLSMRTVVGTRATQTFFFQDEIEYVEFNPYWGIPRSILVNKYLPKLYQDPGYLDAIGYEVTDGRGQRIPSAAIDWPRYGANPPFDVRQPPGPKNSLGAMKIMFPNEHAIYMHDTPEKHLFERESRALSNGCVRLQDPRAMAAAVLGWDRAQVDARIAGGQNNRADLSQKIPVYVTYFTAWPNKAGGVDYMPDVYDRDPHVLAAMEKIGAVRSPAG
jgi:murein L,D-transpeptidase YcbB/YkuD